MNSTCFLIFLFFGAILTQVLGDGSGCPNRVFLGCVLRLKAQRVPFEKNILNVIFNIGSEARLMHTCKAYSEIMPCFRDKILECGNDKQRRMLNEVGKTLMFVCSPFSMERQKLLMRHQKCIGEILALPATVGCKMHDSYHGKQLLKCREVCAQKPTDFTCMLKTWISEQNVCTLRDIHDKCGAEASAFYTELQSTVFEPLFPVLCDYPAEYTATVQTTMMTTTFMPEMTTYAPPRTIISLPPSYPHNRMIQQPRVRQINRNIKLKPVDDRIVPFWSPTPGMLPPPDGSPNHFNPYVHHRNFAPNQMFTVTLSPIATTIEPQTSAESQYPLVSLFKKILPTSIPERFSSFFKGDEFPAYELGSKVPIAAKEVFELNTDPTPDPLIDATTTFTIPTTTTTPMKRNMTPFPEINDRFSPIPYPTPQTLMPPISVFSFTNKPKVNETRRAEKWKPWYLGGFSQGQNEEKFKMPLYHGA